MLSDLAGLSDVFSMWEYPCPSMHLSSILMVMDSKLIFQHSRVPTQQTMDYENNYGPCSIIATIMF